MVPPRLRNRVLDSDDDDSAMARSDEDQTQNRSTVINDSENDADVDAEVREVTRSTRMLMVAVEVPTRRQAKISDFFQTEPSSASASGSTRAVSGSKSKVTSKATSKVTSKATSKVTPKATSKVTPKVVVRDKGAKTAAKQPRTVRRQPSLTSDNDEDEDFLPEEQNEPESEFSEPAEHTEEDDEPMVDVTDDDNEDDAMPLRDKSNKPLTVDKSGKKKKASYKCIEKPCGIKIQPRHKEAGDLAPVSNLSTIFGDIISRVIPSVQKLLGSGGYRKLRVATMCSGTESPLLALGMFSKAIKTRGLGNLEIEHVFSCEIEPYKQAYIERNFKPPILFRDVKELGDDEATTAYGARVPVPGDVDILVAGTSCVDFSNLNNKQKSLDDGGESGDTFLGMMRWVERHRPLIVIQENVCGAAWAEMRTYYIERGYSAEFTRFDSKQYYIPHTRQRGYLCAVNVKGSDIPNKWLDAVKLMKRPSATTLEAFMLPDDDPRVYKSRMELAGDPRTSGPVKARTVDWEKCEGRHQRERIDKQLGTQRPVTAWQEGGVCKLLDFMWQDWGRKQVERVLDLMDINFLLSVKDGYDPMYKAAFWNLSQNVDRNTMGGKPEGVCPCLTPHMIAYLCYRGGPMTGIEALHMQGLPIDELLLTRETSQQIQDLAGNAMSSTVVGTCMLAALILAGNRLPERLMDDHMEIDQEEDVSSHIIGDRALEKRALDLSTTVPLEMSSLLAEAERSARLCICEGRFAITENKIRLCATCGFTACDKCGGRPSHVVPETSDGKDKFKNRLYPLEFEHKLKSVLPMRLHVNGLDSEVLDKLRTREGVHNSDLKEKSWKIWRELVLAAMAGEFRFKSLLRQQTWTVIYDAPEARLELLLYPKQPQWRMFAKCPEMEAVNSAKRALCNYPIARMMISSSNDILGGCWELCLPVASSFLLTIEGIGEKVDSWQKRLGYTDPATLKRQIWSGLRFSVPEEDKPKLDRDISGDYKLLPDCGTAQGALHIKEYNGEDPPLFFFLNQGRTGGAEADSFVFSPDFSRLAFGETRLVIAKLDHQWRQSARDGPKEIRCGVNGQWVSVDVYFNPSVTSDATDGVVAVPRSQGLRISCSNDDCMTANAVLVCKVPLRNQAEDVWPKDKWAEIDDIHERLMYESLAWLTERVRSLKQLSSWSFVESPKEPANCERCAPTPPQLKWHFVKNKFQAFEDPQEAAPYERALKHRPAPFVTQLHLDENNLGTLKIGLNVPTLVHRALSRLPIKGRTEKPLLSWRLVSDYIPESRLLLPKYKLSSNKKDKSSLQPPNFITPLRPEQLRSLSWMISQERENISPFIEEEVAEALLPHLNWRAEGRAERPNYVRGGVLADEVGYGKTAITIGLIDSTQADIEIPKEMPGAIPVKATLIVLPGHLGNQWPSEIRKFTGNKYKMIEIFSQTQLNKLTVKEIMDADIILVLASVFRSDKYLSNMAHFACTKTPPSGEGRRFFDWQRVALQDLTEQVDVIRDQGAGAARRRIDEAGHILEKEEAAETFVQKKRLVGSAYAESKQQKPGDKRKRSRGSNDSSLSDEEMEASDSDRTKKSRKSRQDIDPWGLRGAATKRDWTRMVSPALEMFYFNRLVVDEFTYLKGQVHAGITSQKAASRWVLSGTPPLDDFADVKTISVFLNIHLGIDDDQEGKEQNRKKMKKDLTGVEQFTAFKQVYSPHWHHRRQQVAQAFLNQFVRQNFAEIDEIPWKEHIVPVQLPAAERAIYLELEHYLQALDYNVQKSRAKVDNDRDRRQQEALGESKTAEEALIKRCSHFDLDHARRDEQNAVQACDVIVEDRKKQLHSCREDIRRSLQDAVKRYEEIPEDEWHNKKRNHSNDKRPKDLFGEFKEQCKDVGVGDPDANHDIRVMIEEALSSGKQVKVIYSDGVVANPKISPSPKIFFPNEYGDDKGKRKKKEKKIVELPWPTDPVDKVEQLKNKVIYLRGLARKELTGRHRSLRYFTVVRDHQKSARNKVTTIDCPSCKRTISTSDIAVLSSCGHQGCYDCLVNAARLAKCVVDKCGAATRALAVVRADSLGSEDKMDGIGRHHGKKLEKVVELIKDIIPEHEKVLLFVQFPDLMQKVATTLGDSRINYLQIQGDGKKQSSIVEKFQNSTGPTGVKVMLLNVMAQSSAGANFTNANHVIILSPLLTETQYEYESSETQAIGRVRRYGQTRTVQIWRFMSEDTMDVEIYEKRTQESRTSEEFKKKIYKL